MTEHQTALRVALRKAWSLVAALALVSGVFILPSSRAQAMDHDVKAVLVVSAYGLVGGTVLGLAALPFNQDIRTVFIGSSLGLYLGIAVGIYYVYDRYDQDNPLRTKAADSQSGSGDSGADGRLRLLASARAVSGFELSGAARAPLHIDVPILNF